LNANVRWVAEAMMPVRPQILIVGKGGLVVKERSVRGKVRIGSGTDGEGGEFQRGGRLLSIRWDEGKRRKGGRLWGYGGAGREDPLIAGDEMDVSVRLVDKRIAHHVGLLKAGSGVDGGDVGDGAKGQSSSVPALTPIELNGIVVGGAPGTSR
jgi:hypothetical protein